MKKQSNYTVSTLAGLIALATVAPGFVEASGARLEEIVVTAQKRSESVQDIPVSISALSASDIEGLKLVSGADIAAHVPNLAVNQPYGEGTAPVFALRGVTTTDYSHNQSSPIAMYVDEVH